MSTTPLPPPPPPVRHRRRLGTTGIVAVSLGGSLLAAGALVVAAVASVAFVLTGLNDGRGHPSTVVDTTPRVVEVVDGDTIVVTLAGHDEKVRLLGIDTPETKDPRKPVQCFGKEASARTAELLPPGTAVSLVRDVEERDRYDRILAYVYRADDGLFVNLELARGGFADLLTYPPNVAHTTELRGAVSEARREQRGLWQACGGPGRPA